MVGYSWDSFQHSTSVDKYRLYFYLAIAHSLPINVLLTLSRFHVFQGERYFFDNFVIELEHYLLNCETRAWDGGVFDCEYDVGVYHGLPWYGHFEAYNEKYNCNDEIHLREKDDGLYVDIDGDSITQYVWKFGFVITRDGIPLKYEELFERIKLDLEF